LKGNKYKILVKSEGNIPRLRLKAITLKLRHAGICGRELHLSNARQRQTVNCNKHGIVGLEQVKEY